MATETKFGDLFFSEYLKRGSKTVGPPASAYRFQHSGPARQGRLDGSTVRANALQHIRALLLILFPEVFREYNQRVVPDGLRNREHNSLGCDRPIDDGAYGLPCARRIETPGDLGHIDSGPAQFE